jgi:hypothetical protein
MALPGPAAAAAVLLPTRLPACTGLPAGLLPLAAVLFAAPISTAAALFVRSVAGLQQAPGSAAVAEKEPPVPVIKWWCSRLPY